MCSHASSFSYLWFLAIFTFFHCSFSSNNSGNIQCIGYEKTALMEFKNDLIDGANRLIADNIPSWFWSTFSGLKYLNISDNNLSSVPLNDFLCSKMDMEQKQCTVRQSTTQGRFQLTVVSDRELLLFGVWREASSPDPPSL
ncbi:hypothetical protein R6Q59_014927 [Mikania micrantha]